MKQGSWQLMLGMMESFLSSVLIKATNGGANLVHSPYRLYLAVHVGADCEGALVIPVIFCVQGGIAGALYDLHNRCKAVTIYQHDLQKIAALGTLQQPHSTVWPQKQF